MSPKKDENGRGLSKVEAYLFNKIQTLSLRPNCGGEIAQWLERKSTDRKVRGSNPTSASRLFLSRLGQPGSIPALVLFWGGMVARHQKGVTAERYIGRNVRISKMQTENTICVI
ncbi:hypothetical protein CSKR_109607 [Clonorchis sinensis]|uniref:Uncharacterized protein n=1 Tax=Clonorchis sinensis TaxID=79923 RepID=A0A3R7DDU7_CLOSI|nr:hypothetical protein CSKR_109607 [Clonorchis sinensis]